MDKNNTIRDLIIMFVKENYKKYLEQEKINYIQEKDIPGVVNKIYVEKKKI